jgi:hypothetical protein
MAFTRHRAVIIIGAVLMVAVPYSRLYLGVHYPGDVLGGYVFAGAALLLGVALVRLCERRPLPAHAALALLFTALPWLARAAYDGHYLFINLSLIAGLASGLVLARERIDLRPAQNAAARLVRGALGMAGLIIIVLALKPAGMDAAMVFFKFWILGFWVTFMTPLIFSRIPRLQGPQ